MITDLNRLLYAKTFMLFVGGLLLTTQFGWKVGLAYFFFGAAVRPVYPTP